MKEKFIVVDSLDELKKNFIGSGKTGSCYKVGNRVFKQYKIKPRFPGLVIQLSSLKDKSTSIILPDEFVYFKEYVLSNLEGYFMDYVDGYKPDKINQLTKIRTIIKALDRLEDETRQLATQDGLLLKDIHKDNILYTKNDEFKVIDTDLSVINPYDEVYNYRENMKELGNGILPIFMGNNEFKDEEVKYMYDLCTIHSKAKPSKVLNIAIDKMENISQKEIVTLQDFKDNLKLIRK